MMRNTEMLCADLDGKSERARRKRRVSPNPPNEVGGAEGVVCRRRVSTPKNNFQQHKLRTKFLANALAASVLSSEVMTDGRNRRPA
jgi:hypothetical protein